MSFIGWMIFRFLLIASDVWSGAITQLEQIRKMLSSISKELPSTEASGPLGIFIPILATPIAQGTAESRSYLCSLRTSIKLCLACKQSDTGGRFLRPCLVQLRGPA